MIQPNDVFESILNCLHEGAVCIDMHGRITFWNKAAEELTGYSAADVHGASCADGALEPTDDRDRPLCSGNCPLSSVLEEHTAQEITGFIRHRDGRRLAVTIRIAPLHNPSSEDAGGAILTFMDRSNLTVCRKTVRKLNQIALIDPLTGIGNRRHTERTLGERLQELKRYGGSFGVLFIDVDHFKNVNDSFGHATGDVVLKAVAEQLNQSLRPFDFAGRWGGDEFVVLLVNIKESDLRPIAERVRRRIGQTSILHQGRPIHVTVSIGAKLACPQDTVESLLNDTDELMYCSRTKGAIGSPRPAPPERSPSSPDFS